MNESQHAYSAHDLSCWVLLHVAADSNGPANSYKSVWYCLYVCRDTLMWTTADISCCIDVNWKLFDGKVIWWCLFQHNARISHETQANHHVMTYRWYYYSQCDDNQSADFAVLELIKCTNLDIKDSACLHVVHLLQHSTSRPATRSTDDTVVNALKKNSSPLLAGKYGKSTKQSTSWNHQQNQGKYSLETERVRAFGALCGFRFRKNVSTEER